MDEFEVKARAFAMPLTSPAFPPGPYRFVNREFFTITYRTDLDALRAVIPAPLEMTEPIVKYEFIRMPDSTGFGDYTESGQVIPVSFRGQLGGYVHAMYLDDEPPIAGGRELWGFPKKLASPSLRVEKDTLLGILRYGPVPVAVASMGYKHRALPQDKISGVAVGRKLLVEDHPARRRQCANMRAGSLLLRRHHGQGSVGGTGRAGTLPSCVGAGRCAARARGRFRRSHPVGSHAGAGDRRPRLSCKLDSQADAWAVGPRTRIDQIWFAAIVPRFWRRMTRCVWTRTHPLLPQTFAAC